MDRCFVIQPFDGSDFDARYDQVIGPAIVNAGFEAYRVDRDPSVNIPIERIEQEIRDSAVVLADISLDNPNVWLEVGLALAFAKPCCLICNPSRERFPFDIVHRKVIRYKTSSPADFDDLAEKVTARLKTVVAANETRRESLKAIVAHPVAGDLDNHEVAVLVAIASEELDSASGATGGHIEKSIAEAGYNRLAASLGIRSLQRKSLISQTVESDYNGNSYKAYRLTDEGETWMLSNARSLSLSVDDSGSQRNPSKPAGESDIPF